MIFTYNDVSLRLLFGGLMSEVGILNQRWGSRGPGDPPI